MRSAQASRALGQRSTWKRGANLVTAPRHLQRFQDFRGRRFPDCRESPFYLLLVVSRLNREWAGSCALHWHMTLCLKWAFDTFFQMTLSSRSLASPPLCVKVQDRKVSIAFGPMLALCATSPALAIIASCMDSETEVGALGRGLKFRPAVFCFWLP